MRNYARTIVAAFWDLDVLHSCVLAVPDGLEIGVVLGLESGPAIEWGHDVSTHGRPRITVSMAMFLKRISTNRTEKHAITMFLLLRFMIGRLAWYGRFPLPCYQNVLHDSAFLAYGSHVFSSNRALKLESAAKLCDREIL